MMMMMMILHDCMFPVAGLGGQKHRERRNPSVMEGGGYGGRAALEADTPGQSMKPDSSIPRKEQVVLQLATLPFHCVSEPPQLPPTTTTTTTTTTTR